MGHVNIAIIFPNQLFKIGDLPYDVTTMSKFIIIEDPLYFRDTVRVLRFNILKLIYQRASMKYYEHYLKQNNLTVEYLDFQSEPDFWYKYLVNPNSVYDNDNRSMINNSDDGKLTIHIIDTVDHLLNSRIDKFAAKYNIKYKVYESNMFLTKISELKDYISTSNDGKFHQTSFYIWQRKRSGILMDGDKPVGNKYTFDKENRKSIPGKDFDKFINDNNIKYPVETYNNEFYEPAIKYCEATFNSNHDSQKIHSERDNYGNTHPKKDSQKIHLERDNYMPENIHLYPVTHADTLSHFKLFIAYKLRYFGDYQDAISDHPFMFHSVISPQLNNGLITPKVVLDTVIDLYVNSSADTQKVILPAVEGFIRQLNWREYSRMLYLYAEASMKANYFNNTRRLTQAWYDGTTGIIPVDLAIKSAFQYGYIHHITRLMVVCNFMNLCRIHPDDAYRWFMEFSLDSYDWVMINNVYSMGMFADGGLTTTKLYISTAGYIKKQSNIPDGEWAVTWKTLYYYFIYSNYDKLTGRSALYKSQWDAREAINKKQIIHDGKRIIEVLTTE